MIKSNQQHEDNRSKGNFQLFKLGDIVYTAGVNSMLEQGKINTPDIFNMLRRHSRGDWGNIHEEDIGLNEEAIKHGNQILSVYHIADKIFWVVTEHDRSRTTILLPTEY